MNPVKNLSSLDFFTKIKVQKQLYLIFFIAIFIPVVGVGGYLVRQTRNQLFDHYASQTHSDNLRVKSLLLDLTSNVYRQSQTLASDPELTGLLGTSYESGEEGLKAARNCTILKNTLSQDASLGGVAVYTWNSTIPDSTYIHPITDALKSEPWFFHASTSVTPFWNVETERSNRFGTEIRVLCLYTRIFLPNIRSYAILKTTVSRNYIKNRIENSSMHTVLWLNDQEIFYSSDDRLALPDLGQYDSLPGESFSGTLCPTPGDRRIGTISNLSAVYSDDIFRMASLSLDGYPQINRITGVYVGILALVLSAASLFVYAFSRYFSGRLNTLRESMHRASMGDYNITDHFHGEDEISEVFTDLKKMIEEIRQKEASIYQAQIRTQELVNQQQQMEFKMLSSQINPHFLYNTLETIRMRSLKAGNREVANAVKLLGKSMRYVLGNTTTASTSLARELDYIETYLAIQKLRFHDRVNYSLSVRPPVDLNDYEILPLLLQPIVENAILHGLEEVEQNGRIILHIEILEPYLRIRVYDNGCGMTPEEIRKMEDNIYHHPKDSSRSIGLYNINQRIELCYGFGYGIQVQSKKGWGTLVTMVIPAKKFTGGMTNETADRR